MEKIIMDLLNAGIGILKSGKEGFQKGQVELEKAYKELVSKGASDNSEASIKIRESIDKVLKEVKDLSSVAGKNYEETRKKIIENYNKITNEIKEKMPEGQIEAIKTKINEVTEAIKNATSKVSNSQTASSSNTQKKQQTASSSQQSTNQTKKTPAPVA